VAAVRGASGSVYLAAKGKYDPAEACAGYIFRQSWFRVGPMTHIDRALAGLAITALLALLAGRAAAAEPLVSEVRFGVYEHDTGLIAQHVEKGADFALELLSQPLDTLALIGSPRLVVGGALNSAGRTDQIYVGLTKQWEFVHAVFHPADAFFLEGTFGGDWNDGKKDVSGTPEAASWKSHGSHLLFRTGADFGYRIGDWSLALSFNHISNAGLARKNDGINDLGLRLGMRL
jgi:lipid A 3-O-deacylase